MLNVFERALRKGVPEKRYGGERAWQRLVELDQTSHATALVGPDGLGKASLLETFYSPENRRRMLEEEMRIVAAPESYPIDLSTSDDIYKYFFDTIKDTCCSLLLEEAAWYKQSIKPMSMEGCTSTADCKSRFRSLLRKLKEQGYSVTLVLDHFQEFTMPRYVNENDPAAVERDVGVHRTLNAIMDEQHMGLNFVVATDYDLTKVKYKEMVGSVLLKRFKPNTILLEGLDLEACKALRDDLLADDPIQLSDSVVQQAYLWSGGIPVLLLHFLSRMYELKAKGATQIDVAADVYAPLNKTCRDLLEGWLKHLDADEKMVLRMLRDGELAELDLYSDAVSRLEERGLLVRPLDAPEELEFNSIALEDYVMELELETNVRIFY